MRRIYLLIAALFFCCPAFAGTLVAQHALAMHGAPLYPADFKHVDYANPDAPKGGTLKRAEIGTFDNLNPFLITGRVTTGLQDALLLTYDSLMVQAWNEPFTLYGLVARQVVVPKKRNWIEFHLDPEARFHDGVKMTAQDVAFSHDALMHYGRPNQRRIYKLVQKITIKDDRTIRFDLGPGYDRETVMILAKMPVLPKHYWAKHKFEKTTLTPPLGSGPYRVADVRPGQRVVFERVKDYWAKDKPINRGLYNFDKLQFDWYRDDHVALQALASGDIDLRREYSALSWQRDYDMQAIKQGKLRKELFSNGRPMRARFFVFNLRRFPFDDIRVRQALALAFDFEWLNKSLYLGTQTRVSSLFTHSELADKSADAFVPPHTDGSGVIGLRPNLRRATALLKEAGWQVKNGALTRLADGRTMAFEILLNDPAEEKIALEYSRNLARLGIVASLRTVDTAQYVARLSSFDFDVTSSFWRNSLSPGTEQGVYWGSAAAKQEGSFNYSGLQDPQVDKAIAALTSAQARPELVTAAQKLDHLVMAQSIGVPLFDAADDRIAYRATLAHPALTPLYGPVVESWWRLPEKSVKEVDKTPSLH